ncbi:MAG: hypothetical protein HY260_22165 [Chloroflexi bacterium]|nr:hypothetical protein [Chloroflexota bacterium]
MKKTTYLTVSVVLALSMLLAACGGDASVATNVPAATDVPVATDVPATEPVDSGNVVPTEVPTVTPPLDPATIGDVDTGFRPETDGFSIENYGGEVYTPTGEMFQVTNMTSVEMRRMFGDVVCAAQPESDGTCVLTPPASQWMEQNNSDMSGGHCEGFAVLSQLIYDGKVDPNQFGAASTFDLQIPDNEALQREIAYWWATQGPVRDPGTQRLAPKDAIDYLKIEYSNNPKNLISLGISKEDGTGGHAITAYGVQEQGNGVYWIMVYDNNYPGQERHMTVDTNANTWEYEASINPSVEPDLYKGSPDNPLQLTPDQSRLTVFPCDFCNGTSSGSQGGNGLSAPAPRFNEIFTEGYVNVELQDDKGRKIGYDENGKFVNEITEAKIQPIHNGTLSEVAPVINMPVGMDFTAYIWGDDKAAEIPASLVMIGKGFYIGIDGLAMAPGQEDQLFVDGGGDAINYKTDAEESPDIIVGIEKPGADFELALKAVKASKGTDISVVFDQKEDVFAFQTTSDAQAQFSISITRYDTNGDEETFDTGDTPIQIDPEKLMYFYFGKWEGQGSNLEVGYDENGNGNIEDSEITNMADAK